MTSQSSTINERITCRAGFRPLFGFSMKQFWTTMLLFGIILFFVIPVPVLMLISVSDLHEVQDLIEARNTFATEWAVVIRYALIPIVSAFGIVVSCSRFKYLKIKVAVDFYHSLPVKRSRLYVTQLSISALSIIIPYVINILLAVIFLGTNGLMSGTLAVNLLLTTCETFVYALFIYSVCTLIGMVSGLTAVQLTLTAVGLFILPAVYLLTFSFVNIFNENMWYNYYVSEDVFKYLSPCIRFLMLEDSLSVIETVTMILLSAGMLLGAYAVYTKRRSERSGTPVVFGPLGEVIKYVLVFIGTLVGGLLFYFITDESFIWTVFGMVCGMVLVFMLTNTILQKTAKAMFKGAKGLCIFAGVTAVCMVVLMTNLFGINNYVPAPENTAKVEIRFDYSSTSYEFTDPECIEAVHRIYTARDPLAEDEYYTHRRGGNWWNYETVNVCVIFRTKLGFPIAKELRLYNKSDFIEEFRVLLDSEEFQRQYAAHTDSIEGNGYNCINFSSYRIDRRDGYLWYNYADNGHSFKKLEINTPRSKELGIPLILQSAKNAGFDYFQRQTYGELQIDDYSGDHSHYCYPLYSDETELVKHHIGNGFLTMSPEDTVERLAGLTEGITVYYTPAGETESKEHTFTDKDEIRELLSASVNIFGATYGSEFVFADTEFEGVYSVDVRYGNREIYSDSHGYYMFIDGEELVFDDYATAVEVYDSRVSSDTLEVSKREFELSFLRGKVPEFVYKAFGVK